MEFKIKTGDFAAHKTPCLVVGIFEKRKLSAAAERLDHASDGYLSQRLKSGDIDGTAGQTLLLYAVPGVAAERVLVIGLGKKKETTRAQYRQAFAAATTWLQQSAAGEATCVLPDPLPPSLDLYGSVRDLVITVADKVYRYSYTKTDDKRAPKTPLKRVTVWVSKKAEMVDAERAVQHGQAMAEGIRLARELGNLPGNLCTPSYLADQARALGARYPKLNIEVLDEAQLAELGMGALLSVSRGSRQPAKLIVMHYQGAAKATKPLVLVGKGLTFDAGGISLKPAAEMDEMKYDMAGGAAVIGALCAACELELPLHLIGVVPASENLPDGAANKPGDIVTSLSGQTIEILNTDAEGRLILCDALTYCERFEPEIVIDLATLTGACVIALGKHPAGLFTADDRLAAELLAAGEAAGDRAWRLPLWEEYQPQLDSNFADMANVGGRDGGAITAACFLSRFTKHYRWAHLDIAGIAWQSGKDKGGTGRPVALLTHWLLERAGQQ
ncbi:leucyl aminopeptidase [Allochromatium warmingii]|uniref:Probable cytosol aminopeptidase n=1 Tax=Allochromatium warmingii TaxID=61595 RepID=A0A1H3HWA4_ALLWA|nr:leucyl aminopeptidase [Allochromatium warmingii]SDY19535.1 leucyl aminopeptidase [Allochromatium warmingii]